MNIKHLAVSFLALALSISNGICQEVKNNDDKKAIISDKYLLGVYEMNVTKNSPRAGMLFAEILELDSTHSPSYDMLSKIISVPSEALQHSINAHKYDSTNIWYQKSLAAQYLQNKMYDDAIRIAKETIEMNPDDINSYSNLVTIYSKSKDFDSAEKVIDKFDSKFGITEESMLNRAQLYQETPASDTLISKLKLMAEAHPTNAIPLIILGEKHLNLNRDTLALKYYKQAEEIDATNIKLILSLSDYYLKHRDIENLTRYIRKTYPIKQLPLEAKIAFIEEILFTAYFYDNHFLKVDNLVHTLLFYYQDNLLANNIVAQHYINTRDLNKAIAQHLSVIEKGIADKETYYAIIGLNSYQKEFDSMILYCDKMVEQYPDTKNSNALQKSYAYMEMEQFEKGIATIMDVTSSPKDKEELSEMYGMIGDIYHEWGKSSASYASYKKALKYNPDNIPVLNNYSYHLSENNTQLKRASKMIKRVIAIEPENSTYLDTYGWILYQMGEHELAEIVLKKAVTNDKDSSGVILMHYGDVLYELGKTVKAKVYWLKAKENDADKEKIAERLSR